ERERLILDRDAVVRDEIIVRQRRAGRDHLGARDDQARIGLLLYMHEDVAPLLDRAIAIDRRIDDGMIPEVEPLLGPGIPLPGITGVFAIEARIRAQRA